ncbi:MAG: hypothetical protein ABIG30_00645 [Candidatus Aenigmatarchaeota archaeon]
MEIVLAGLALIILAWFIQLVYAMKGSNDIHYSFIIVYVIGVAIVAADSYMTGLKTIAMLNLATFALAVLVMIETRLCYKPPKSRKPRKKPRKKPKKRRKQNKKR